mgnify:CR=1 FL=1
MRYIFEAVHLWIMYSQAGLTTNLDYLIIRKDQEQFEKHDHVTGVHEVGAARVMLSLNGRSACRNQ